MRASFPFQHSSNSQASNTTNNMDAKYESFDESQYYVKIEGSIYKKEDSRISRIVTMAVTHTPPPHHPPPTDEDDAPASARGTTFRLIHY